MKVAAPFWVTLLWSCGFSPSAAIDARPEDAPVDSSRDGGPNERVRQGLIGFWTFDDPMGSRVAADTAGAGSPVPLQVITSSTLAAPTFISGTLVVETPARMYSQLNPHLNGDCIASGAVTLEVWAKPAEANIDPSESRFVGGLGANIQEHNIALLQTGSHWVGLVRTTQDKTGTPGLTSTSTVSSTSFSHVAIVADSTQRTMYVDGSAQAVGTPGTLSSWDPMVPMALVDEYQHAWLWTGTLALVAIYNRALTQEEIHQNFTAGPDH